VCGRGVRSNSERSLVRETMRQTKNGKDAFLASKWIFCRHYRSFTLAAGYAKAGQIFANTGADAS